MPSLNDSPAAILRAYLISESLVTLPSSSSDWPCYRGGLTDEPDNCISIQDAPGSNDGRYMTDGSYSIHPGFALLVRSNSYSDAYSKIEAIYDALSALSGESVSIGDNDYKIQACSLPSYVAPLQRDEDNRMRFILNGTMTLKAIA